MGWLNEKVLRNGRAVQDSCGMRPRHHQIVKSLSTYRKPFAVILRAKTKNWSEFPSSSADRQRANSRTSVIEDPPEKETLTTSA